MNIKKLRSFVLHHKTIAAAVVAAVTLVSAWAGLALEERFFAGRTLPVIQDTGGTVRVLNPHSNPKKGEHWSVVFVTKGKGSLAVSPDSRESRQDFIFVSLSCGEEKVTPEFQYEEAVMVRNWRCDEEAKVVYLISEVRRHVVRISFAGDNSYAYNGSFNFDSTLVTMTPAMAKRNAPGPFAAAPNVQGDWNTTNGDSDALTLAQGTQINGNFYANWDASQGSISLWYTPEHSGDSKDHYLAQWSTNGYLKINTSNQLELGVASGVSITATASMTAGTTYHIAARWDADNTLDGTNYLSISFNDTHTFGRTTSYTAEAPASTIYIGSNSSSQNPANGIIEGLTIYRRPLYDGTYGINVGNGDEINQIYNAGSGKDPTLVTGSWDVVFALPTNSSTGALVTGTGEAWTHPHASNLLYTSTTNTGGFMMNGTYTSDGWVDGKGNSSVAALAASEKIYNGGYKFTTSSVTADFESTNSEALSITDNAALSTGAVDFTIAAWVKLESKSASMAFVAKTNSSTNREHQLFYNVTTDTFSFRTFNSSGGIDGTLNATTFGSPSTGVWYFVTAWRDATNGLNYISINNGTADSLSITNNPADSTANFRIGTYTGASGFFDGLVDQVGFFKGILSSADRTLLYNSGAGRVYGDLSNAFKTNNSIQAWWELDESSGTRYDSYGSNNLSDLNTVTSATGIPTGSMIYYDKTVVAGDDWVVRALAHSDGTSIPKIVLYDQTNGAEIGSLTGTTTSTRTAPNVFIFTGEAPAGMTTLRVKLINTASTGTAYWHQVEVLTNLVTNPSMATGSGDPWIPTGWSNSGLTFEAGDLVQESTTIHSGSSGLKMTSGATVDESLNQSVGDLDSGEFAAAGFWSYGDGTTGTRIGAQNGGYASIQSETATENITGTTSASWAHTPGVWRGNETMFLFTVKANTATGNRFVDDVYVFLLSDVSLTVTPATLANSTETSGIRVDGRDTLSQAVSGWTTTAGTVKWKYTPRHSAADAIKFQEAGNNAFIATFVFDTSNYIRLYWNAANTITMDFNMNGTTGSGTWDATGAIAAGTTYRMTIDYTGGSTMTLSVDDSTKITLSGIPAAFGTTPTTAYWGSRNTSDRHADGVYGKCAVTCPPKLNEGNYSLECSCTYTNSLDGVEVGNLTVPDNYTLTLNNATTLVWTPNNSITVDGTIVLNSGAAMKRGYIVFTDADGDDYPASTTPTFSATAPSGNEASRSATPNYATADCDDAVSTATTDCTIKRVFVTTGVLLAGNVGGLSGADSTCQGIADGKGWTGTTWKAWLSDSSTAAQSRISNHYYKYRLLDGSTVIAVNWADLTDGSIGSPINIDQSGATVTGNLNVWTNTATNGSITSANTSDNCSNWTSLIGTSSTTGQLDQSSSSWTASATTRSCNDSSHLYCLEQ